MLCFRQWLLRRRGEGGGIFAKQQAVFEKFEKMKQIIHLCSIVLMDFYR